MSDASSAPLGRDLAILLGVQLVVLLPFLAKPVHVDAPFFVEVADQIRAQPGAPYAFHYNWTGTLDDVWVEMKNPPLYSYLLAAVRAWLGSSAVAMHLGMLGLPLLAAAAMYALARRFVARPLYAALLLVLGPAYWVAATNLMADILLLALWLVALAAALEAQERDSAGLRWLAGAAAACALWTKYNAVLLLGLLWVHAWLAGERRPRAWAPLLLPVAALGAWHAFSGGHLATALEYRAGGRFAPERLLGHTLAVLSFAGGLLVVPCVSWIDSAKNARTRGIALAGAGVGALVVVIKLALFRFEASPANELLLFVLAGSAVSFFARALADPPAWRGTPARLMALWLAGGMLFLAFGNWTVNYRVLLLFAPPALLVFAAQSEAFAWQRRAALALCGLVGCAVVVADGELARFGPRAAQIAGERFAAGEGVRFAGHWGFQYAMEGAGFEHVDQGDPQLAQGDILIVPRLHRVSSDSIDALLGARQPIESRRFERRFPLAVMSDRVGAGLYGSFLGHMPFAFTGEPVEVVDEYRW